MVSRRRARGGVSVCPREGGSALSSMHESPTRRILSISSIDRVVIRVHASRL